MSLQPYISHYSGISGQRESCIGNNTLVSGYCFINSVNLFADMHIFTYRTQYSLLPLPKYLAKEDLLFLEKSAPT